MIPAPAAVTNAATGTAKHHRDLDVTEQEAMPLPYHLPSV
jgi:hypothetical protein